jgi:hypothetical protein
MAKAKKAIKKVGSKKTAVKKKPVKKAVKKKAAPKKAVKKKIAPKKVIVKKKVAKKAAVKKAVKKKSTTKKPVAKKTATGPVPGNSKPAKKTGKVDEVSVRMYCHGFGDCFLLTFLSQGDPVYRMLIDCGMLTGDSDRLKKVIANIKTECKDHLDLVVQTHEHKDHISGFNLKDEKKNLLWDSIDVDNVWLAWTENIGSGGDELAKELKDKFKKKKNALAKALGLYNEYIEGDAHRALMEKEFSGTDYHSAQQRYASALQQLLGFYDIDADEVKRSLKAGGGELGLTMKDAMAYFIERNIKNNGTPHINFWNPGDSADEETTGLEGIKFYFLGPPKNYDLLRKMDDNEHVEMYMTDMGLSDNFYMALGDSEPAELSPFQSRYLINNNNEDPETLKDPEYVWNLYHDKKNVWRNIETDWLQNAGTLALNLDSYTNNTSLVIAIEFEPNGKVLLFAADAQIGNWISWTEPEKEGGTTPRLKWNAATGNGNITAYDLLKRTVFYKVGHHASHNATAKKHGMELMTSTELAAMIPVDEDVAKKQGKKGWKMPAEDLYQRLQEKTKGRIIRLDKGNLLKNGVEEIAEGAKPTQQQRQQFNSNVKESQELVKADDGDNRPLFWEYNVKC